MRLDKASLWLSALLMLAGCPGNEPRLGAISVACDPASVVAGQPSQCTASATDQDGKPFTVSNYSWSSSDESVATVDSTGRATTLASATTAVRTVNISASATSDGVTQRGQATLTVTAQPPRLSAITVTCDRASVPATRPAQCAASAMDQFGQPFAVSGYTWTSSDETVATVGSTGRVTTRTTGTVTLRASATSGGVSQQGQASLAVTEAQPTLHSTPITANETWSEANNPHVVQGTLDVGGASAPTLTLSAGTVVRFESGAMLRAGQTEPGGLIVDGTEAAPVLLTADSANPQPGHWQGVHLTHHASSPSRISHATIEYAGAGGGSSAGRGNLNVYGLAAEIAPGPVLQHVVARKSSGPGFYLGYGGNIGSGSTGLLSRDNGGYAISATATHIGGIPPNTTVSGNTRDAVEVVPPLFDAQTWPNLGIPYVINSDFFEPGSTLTLLPGTELRFGPNARLVLGYMRDPAVALIAMGTAQAPIRFVPDTSAPTKGYWGGLSFWNATGSRLDHVIVTHAGTESPSPMGNGNVGVNQEIGAFITNSTFSDSLGCGITRSNGSRTDTSVVTTDFTLPEYNNTFINNDAGAQCTN